MVELRKARGDTLEFHKVSLSSATRLAHPLIYVTKILNLFLLQFYKNLSTGLKDVVWKSEDDMHDNLKE